MMGTWKKVVGSWKSPLKYLTVLLDCLVSSSYVWGVGVRGVERGFRGDVLLSVSS